MSHVVHVYSVAVEETCTHSLLASNKSTNTLVQNEEPSETEEGIYPEPVPETGNNISGAPGMVHTRTIATNGPVSTTQDHDKKPLIPKPPDKLNDRYKWCLSVMTYLAVVAAVAIIINHIYIACQPDLITKEFILSNNTILLDPLSTGTSMPVTITSYDTLTVEISKPITSVTILVVKSEVPCRANHTKTRQFNSANISIGSHSFINVIVEQYLTPGSTLFLNFTITAGPEKIFGKNDKEAIILCIIDNKDLYEHFKGNNGELNDCKDHDKYTYYVSNGTMFSLNYTFHESRYFFIIFLSTRDNVYVQYSYNLTYYYYEIQDYTSLVKCTISENKDWKNCSLDVDGAQGCFIAYAAPSVGSPAFTKMMVTLIHNPFTSMSAGLIVALAVIVILICMVALGFFIMYIRKKKQRSSH